MKHLREQVRDAIRRSEKTRYRLSQETGIDQAQLCRMMAEGKGISVEALETLAAALGLEIILRPCRNRSLAKRKTRPAGSSRPAHKCPRTA